MKVGILADIHEHIERLAAAVALFKTVGVHRVMFLGDVFETGKRIADAVALLQSCAAVGVWGNHELGFCVGPPSDVVMQFDVNVRRYLGSLQPSMELGNLHFSHGMPHWDATDPVVYCLGEPPWDGVAAQKVFKAFPHQVFFMEHCHRWFITSSAGEVETGVDHLFVFSDAERYLVVVNAVVDGWCAILDTDAKSLTPCFVGQKSMCEDCHAP